MEIRNLTKDDFPSLLSEINDPPKSLRYEGELPILGNKLLAVVGSRKYSSYGREICESIIKNLQGYPITIVSGLALGMDSIAHRAAISARLQTIAIPGSGLSRKVIHPQSHVGLADEIVQSGGGLLSEYSDDTKAALYTFPRRNRIMAGMCHATLVIEAESKSGTLITSRLATEYNRDVGAIPGPVNSPTSDGPHMLIRLGAALIRDYKDVLELLDLRTDLESRETETLVDLGNLNDNERLFIDILGHSTMTRDELIRKAQLDTATSTATLSLLEIKGFIVEEMGEVRIKI